MVFSVDTQKIELQVKLMRETLSQIQKWKHFEWLKGIKRMLIKMEKLPLLLVRWRPEEVEILVKTKLMSLFLHSIVFLIWQWMRKSQREYFWYFTCLLCWLQWLSSKYLWILWVCLEPLVCLFHFTPCLAISLPSFTMDTIEESLYLV